MEDKTNDENLDLLFTGSIDPMETEPSDRFWRRAAEEILKLENGGYKRKVFAWRSVAALLASLVIMLSAYAIYMHTQITTIETKIAYIEKQQMINTNQTSNGQEKESETNTIASTPISNQQSSSDYSKDKKESALVINNASSGQVDNSNATGKNGANKIAAPTLADDNIASVNNHAQEIGLQQSFDSTSNVPDKIVEDSMKSFLSSPARAMFNQSIRDTSIVKKHDSSGIGSIANVKPDTLSKPVKPSKLRDPRTLKQRLSVSAFFAPKIEDDFLSGDDVTSNTTPKDVKTREDDQFAFSTGVRLGYDVTRHWSVFTGFYYHSSSFSIKPVLVAAQQQEDGDVGYSITTSSGVVDFTDSDLHPKVGDSIKASIQSSRNYISVPFQLRYDFSSTHRLGFYLTGGVAINFAYNNTTEIHWENTQLQEGDILIRTIPDLDNVQYTYTLAAGAKYLFAKRFYLFVEPYFEGSFGAINKTAPIKAYPLSVGLSAGLTYHF